MTSIGRSCEGESWVRAKNRDVVPVPRSTQTTIDSSERSLTLSSQRQSSVSFALFSPHKVETLLTFSANSNLSSVSTNLPQISLAMTIGNEDHKHLGNRCTGTSLHQRQRSPTFDDYRAPH